MPEAPIKWGLHVLYPARASSQRPDVSTQSACSYFAPSPEGRLCSTGIDKLNSFRYFCVPQTVAHSSRQRDNGETTACALLANADILEKSNPLSAFIAIPTAWELTTSLMCRTDPGAVNVAKSISNVQSCVVQLKSFRFRFGFERRSCGSETARRVRVINTDVFFVPVYY